MSLPFKTHCIKPNGFALCRNTIFEESFLRIEGVAAFLKARDEGHQYLCGSCLARCEERLQPGTSETHRDITSWAKRRMLELGLTRNDIAARTGLVACTVQSALNKKYTRPGAQTDVLIKIVAALGGKLVINYEIHEEVTSES